MGSTRPFLQIFLWCFVNVLFSKAKGQFYTEYGDAGGGFHLPPYDIPVVYKHQTFPAAYPVASTVYEVALMQPIEAMPGKKTVPLYIVPEDSLLIRENGHSRVKRSLDGLSVNVKYPEFYGITDGYHIPAVELPLNNPLQIRQLDLNVIVPEGFMVPQQGIGREHPYPLSTGCLIASMPRNEYVGDDHPITIKRLFAVPGLPEYPTYRPAFADRSFAVPGLPAPPNSPHAIQPQPRPHQEHPHNDVIVNLFTQDTGRKRNRPRRPLPPGAAGIRPGGGFPPYGRRPRPRIPDPPVFELVPVNRRGNRRNGKRKNKNKNDSYEDSGENYDEYDEYEDEDDKKCNRRNGRRNRNCKKKKDGSTTTTTKGSTTTTTTPTTTTTTTTTTTPKPATQPTTPLSASSIQDIIAAFSSFREREKSRAHLSATFPDDDQSSTPFDPRNRDNDRQYEGSFRDDHRERRPIPTRSGNSASRNNRAQAERTEVERERERLQRVRAREAEREAYEREKKLEKERERLFELRRIERERQVELERQKQNERERLERERQLELGRLREREEEQNRLQRERQELERKKEAERIRNNREGLQALRALEGGESRPQPRSNSPSPEQLQAIRQRMVERQISQLETLLSSLNVKGEGTRGRSDRDNPLASSSNDSLRNKSW